MEESIKYYQRRLLLVRELFKDHQTDLLEKNLDKIKALVDGYNRFKNHPDYDKLLAEFPQTFILN